MQEIQVNIVLYPMSNVYNVDESGLFYRQRPNKAYLAPNENRRNTRGTDLQNHKQRMTISLCCNADGSHIVPTRHIG